ncbi:high mobility group box domain-containing protein [Dimargaris cristalligena]|uniref:High mobility group box domain-containing protein n=1 Tax=Dimargaris cristalligena TaxID=215637 RepID=A0A4Q0A2M4_9FUNG|nr:high mobility group box domain-containing protein [Dimargaris cristalligena]|eukprot:RKP40386.1 high mobility group box domain-containing protein [Dimargaris cristalligena]
MSEPLKQQYFEKARSLKDKFVAENPDFVYTRRPNNSRRVAESSGDVGRPHQGLGSDSDEAQRRGKGAKSGPASAGGKGARGAVPINPLTRPDRLKRPMNAYLIFNQDMRHRLLSENPNMSVSEISKSIGDKWRAMDAAQKHHYNQRAQQLKDDFKAKNPNYVFTRRTKKDMALQHGGYHDDDDDDEDNDDAQGDGNGGGENRSRKKRIRGGQAPRHPMSAFLYYLREQRPAYAEQFPGSSVGPISKLVAQKWRLLSVEERVPWQEKADADKRRYAEERAIYHGQAQPNTAS